MGKYSKHPVTLLLALGALLMIVGNLMGWYKAPEGVDLATLVDNGNQVIVIVVAGLLGLLVTYFAAQNGSKGLMALDLLFALVGLSVFALNAPSQNGLDALGVGMSAGFQIGMLGALLFLIMSIAGLVVYKRA